MNAIERALEVLDAREVGLGEVHTCTAVRNGGAAVWLPEVVLIAMPWDPVEGDHEHTMTVLFCCGDALRMAEYGAEWARRGYTHVVWCRGFKKGYQGYQKRPLAHWAALTKRMNRVHG